MDYHAESKRRPQTAMLNVMQAFIVMSMAKTKKHVRVMAMCEFLCWVHTTGWPCNQAARAKPNQREPNRQKQITVNEKARRTAPKTKRTKPAFTVLDECTTPNVEANLHEPHLARTGPYRTETHFNAISH